jgi:hypothetical protein
MGYNIGQAVWPTFSISDQTKALIDKFFRLMDDGSTGVGDKLADEVFTFDGSLSGATGTATGTSGMSVQYKVLFLFLIFAHCILTRNSKMQKERMESGPTEMSSCQEGVHAQRRWFRSDAHWGCRDDSFEWFINSHGVHRQDGD